MKIKINNLELHNFKGVKDLNINFGDITNVYGENGTGKSTIVDAFMWLFFDKDSKDRKNFEIKTIDENGEVIHGLEHSVTGTLEIDGNVITLSKIYKEKWTKKRGMATKEFTGHETLYSINEVPVKKKEFEEKVSEILKEKTFKLVTNPVYFPSLSWKEQRDIIQDIIGDIDDSRVINYNSNLKALEGKYEDSIDNYRVRTKATIQKLNEKIKQIPFRIDECNNSIADEDFKALENQKLGLKKEIDCIDEQLQDKSKANEVLMAYKQHSYDLKQEYQTKLNHAKSVVKNPLHTLERKFQDCRYKVQEAAYSINSLERDKRSLEDEIKIFELNSEKKKSEVQDLREKFKEINNRSFELDPGSTVCPTCNRELENSEEIIKDLEEKFNLAKVRRKQEINEKGAKLNQIIKDIEVKIEEDRKKLFDKENEIKDLLNQKLLAEQEVKDIEDKINNFVIPLDSELEFEGKAQLISEIKATEEDINNFKIDDNTELISKKRKLQADLEQVNKLLASKENNDKLRARITELGEEERELSNKVAELEGQLFLCEDFVRTKVELSEGLINQKFKNISFKLFKDLINGGLEETCEILIEGVPYSNANTASQINAGIEVINTLCNHYRINAPIFIDNREAVNKIAPTDSQIINLIVSNDKELLVEVEK